MDFKNKKTIIGLIVIIVFLLFLFIFASSSKEPMLISSGDASSDASGDYPYVEFEVDANQDIVDLFSAYYDAYANGDITALEAVASPVSDFEQGYIKVMSEYVESYNDIKVHVKQGLDESSFIVSASFMMKFNDIDTEAPGIETYYVQQDADGNYMINNIYSWFNLSSGEQAVDDTIVDRINAYKSEADVVSLFSEIESSYTAALESDETLAGMVNSTVSDAISAYIAEYSASLSNDDTDSSEETDSADAADTSDTDTTDADSADTDSVQYIDPDTSIYLQETLVVRSKMSSESDRIGNAFGGDTLVVIKSYDTGWTKVKWGKETGYVRTDLLLEQ